jgi:dTDP-4-amino-4,6-dideoxygalactose transaminase
LGTYSFHETKNVISGEGGALLVNDERFVARAEIIREKGTNRSHFFRGHVDKYTWVDIGSSYLPGEVIAAFLWAQLEEAETITQRRLAIWGKYHYAFRSLEESGLIRRPIMPKYCNHNAHMYYILLDSFEKRCALVAKLKEAGIYAVFHYVPLHTSLAGRLYARTYGSMTNTTYLADRLLRLPMWTTLSEGEISRVVNEIDLALRAFAP